MNLPPAARRLRKTRRELRAARRDVVPPAAPPSPPPPPPAAAVDPAAEGLLKLLKDIFCEVPCGGQCCTSGQECMGGRVCVNSKHPLAPPKKDQTDEEAKEEKFIRDAWKKIDQRILERIKQVQEHRANPAAVPLAMPMAPAPVPPAPPASPMPPSATSPTTNTPVKVTATTPSDTSQPNPNDEPPPDDPIAPNGSPATAAPPNSKPANGQTPPGNGQVPPPPSPANNLTPAVLPPNNGQHPMGPVPPNGKPVPPPNGVPPLPNGQPVPPPNGVPPNPDSSQPGMPPTDDPSNPPPPGTNPPPPGTNTGAPRANSGAPGTNLASPNEKTPGMPPYMPPNPTAPQALTGTIAQPLPVVTVSVAPNGPGIANGTVVTGYQLPGVVTSGAVAGILSLSIILLVSLVLLLFCCLRWKKWDGDDKNASSASSPGARGGNDGYTAAPTTSQPMTQRTFPQEAPYPPRSPITIDSPAMFGSTAARGSAMMTRSGSHRSNRSFTRDPEPLHLPREAEREADPAAVEEDPSTPTRKPSRFGESLRRHQSINTQLASSPRSSSYNQLNTAHIAASGMPPPPQPKTPLPPHNLPASFYSNVGPPGGTTRPIHRRIPVKAPTNAPAGGARPPGLNTTSIPEQRVDDASSYQPSPMSERHRQEWRTDRDRASTVSAFPGEYLPPAR